MSEVIVGSTGILDAAQVPPIRADWDDVQPRGDGGALHNCNIDTIGITIEEIGIMIEEKTRTNRLAKIYRYIIASDEA